MIHVKFYVLHFTFYFLLSTFDDPVASCQAILMDNRPTIGGVTCEVADPQATFVGGIVAFVALIGLRLHKVVLRMFGMSDLSDAYAKPVLGPSGESSPPLFGGWIGGLWVG